jgi:hypothetical protein
MVPACVIEDCRSYTDARAARQFAIMAALFEFETTAMTTLTYEAFLDEVTTLLTEMYDMEDEAAIKLVMQAQDAEYFVAHDDKPELRTLEQAKKEAVALYKARQNRVETQQKQQRAQHQRGGPKKP